MAMEITRTVPLLARPAGMSVRLGMRVRRWRRLRRSSRFEWEKWETGDDELGDIVGVAAGNYDAVWVMSVQYEGFSL